MGKLSRRDFIPLVGSAIAGGALLSFGTVSASQKEEESFIAFDRLTRPKALASGDTVGICAPAGAIKSDEEIASFESILHSMGFKTKTGKNIKNRLGYFAGTDEERASDFMDMILDEEVNAVFFIRGGWGSARLLRLLDFDEISKHPKIIMGFSDATTLLNAISHKCGFVTFHGPSGNSTWNDYSKNYIKKLLMEKMVFAYQNHPGDTPIRTYKKGSAVGELWGGNLTVITSLLGTEYLPDWEEKILFLEDVSEEPYSIDRMLTQLKLAGVLDAVRGVVLGNFRKCVAEEPERSFTLEEVFEQHFSPYDKPVFYGAQIGHTRNKFTVPIGCQVRMDAEEGVLMLLDSAVR